jgi:hypothetical protein
VAEEGVREGIKLLNWELNYGCAKYYKSDQVRKDTTVDHVTCIGKKKTAGTEFLWRRGVLIERENSE